MHGQSLAEVVIQMAAKLTHALGNPSPTAPFDNIGQQQIKALHRLTETFTSISLTRYQPDTSEPGYRTCTTFEGGIKHPSNTFEGEIITFARSIYTTLESGNNTPSYIRHPYYTK